MTLVMEFYNRFILTIRQSFKYMCFISYEPMNDLVWLLSALTDVKGNLLIAGIDQLVAKLTDTERALYEGIEFDMVISY